MARKTSFNIKLLIKRRRDRGKFITRAINGKSLQEKVSAEPMVSQGGVCQTYSSREEFVSCSKPWLAKCSVVEFVWCSRVEFVKCSRAEFVKCSKAGFVRFSNSLLLRARRDEFIRC